MNNNVENNVASRECKIVQKTHATSIAQNNKDHNQLNCILFVSVDDVEPLHARRYEPFVFIHCFNHDQI